MNIIDIIMTSNPTFVQDALVLPGISDHGILTFTLSADPHILPKPPRNIYLFHTADPQQQAAADFTTEFLQSEPDKRTVESNLLMISDFLNSYVSELVPIKMSKDRRQLPWISPSLKTTNEENG